jgi:uncharacterized OB-fold protein
VLVQRCTACGQRRHYPRPLCAACHAFDHEWLPLGGEGEVHSWTITHQSPLPGFADTRPFTVLTVDMAEGVRVLGLLRGAGAEVLRIGLPVQVSVEEVPGGRLMPVFRLRTDS